MSESEPRFVSSPDGTRIAWYASGDGAPLLLVYGALMADTGWARLRPHLQPGHRIVSFDRRGRGPSADQPVYAAEREVEDVLAVVSAAVDGPLDVFAHSSGALLALLAMQRGLPVRRAVLYEPPVIGMRGAQVNLGMSDRLAELLDDGRGDEALELVLTRGMDVPPDQIERLRAEPRWQEQLGYVRTAAYDMQITLGFDMASLASIALPVLLLVGQNSPQWMRDGVAAVCDAIPGAQLFVLEGQGHNAIFGAPELVAREALPFLAGS